MNIEAYIKQKRAERGDESFGFLAERCETSDDAPYRIRVAENLRRDEASVLVLPGSAGYRIDLEVFNGMLKEVDNFVKKDCGFENVRVCTALWDFGEYHDEDTARTSLWFERACPDEVADLYKERPLIYQRENLSPRYIDDIFQAAVLPKITDDDGKKLPLEEALKAVRGLSILAFCHGGFVAMRLEQLMTKKMAELGYSAKEQKAIKSQTAVLAYNPDCPKSASFFYFVTIESAKDDHNRFNNYMKEWLLMAPRKFGVAYLPKRWGRTLMCSRATDAKKTVWELVPIEELWERRRKKPKERVLNEHGFMGFKPIKNMSKEALKLQKFANNIFKNFIKNALQQKENGFVPLPKIQNLVADDAKEKRSFVKAVVVGHLLEHRFAYANKQKIAMAGNARRSIPVVRLD